MDWRITPGFAFHFLDGPAVPTKIQLPGQLYSAYVNGLWQPQFSPQFGADINVRVGVYTDFRSTTSDSLRITGRGLGVVQLTPNTALKLGVEYFDRLEIKMLPAGGILFEPDPQTRWDLYFPRPKFSKYLTTQGNTEFWWHIGAEYGGGNWTVDRLSVDAKGMSERVDINDIRVFLGVDWNQLDRVDGIAEVGYVFDREIVVKSRPAESIELDDTVMVRVGVKILDRHPNCLGNFMWPCHSADRDRHNVPKAKLIHRLEVGPLRHRTQNQVHKRDLIPFLSSSRYIHGHG